MDLDHFSVLFLSFPAYSYASLLQKEELAHPALRKSRANPFSLSFEADRKRL